MTYNTRIYYLGYSMKFLLSLLLFTLILTADEYPKFFSKLGTPLFEADIAFQKLLNLDNMKKPATDYHEKVKELLHLANFLKKDPMHLEMNRKRYIKELRNLQKEHDNVMKVVNAALVKSIDTDDFLSYSHIINTNLDALKSNEVIRKRIMAYYVSHRTRGVLEPLESTYASIEKDKRLYSYIKSHLPATTIIDKTFKTGGSVYKTLLSKNEDVAFIANDEYCFKVLDIEDISSISEIGSYQFPSNRSSLINISLSSDFNYAYLSDLKNGFAIIDISQEHDPILKSNLSNMRPLASVHTQDNTINFIARKTSGLSIMDSSDEEEPRLLANYNHGLTLNNVVLDEKNFKVFLLHTKGLSIIDISIIGNPRKIKEYEIEGGAYDLVYSSKKEIYFLALAEKGVRVLDISDDEIKLLSSYRTPTNARRLLLNKEQNTLYISALEGGVSEVNILDPLYLKHVMTYKTKKKANAYNAVLNRAEDKLFISYGKAGLAIVTLGEN